MSKLRTFILLLICIGCQLDYADNKRLLFKGSLVDENNLPIENVPIRISVGRSSQFSSDFFEILGDGQTNKDGNYDIVTLSPTAGDISVDINASLNGLSNRVSYRIFGVQGLEESNATYTLPKLKVETLIDSQLEIRRSGSNNDTLFYEIGRNFREKWLDFSSTNFQDKETIDFFLPSGTLLPTETEKQEFLEGIPVSDTIHFRYAFSGGLGFEVMTKDLIYNAENNTYVFNF